MVTVGFAFSVSSCDSVCIECSYTHNGTKSSSGEVCTDAESANALEDEWQSEALAKGTSAICIRFYLNRKRLMLSQDTMIKCFIHG